jgi:hypothetical protein
VASEADNITEVYYPVKKKPRKIVESFGGNMNQDKIREMEHAIVY